MMNIPEWARKNFEIKENDDEATIRLKKYFLNNDKFSRELAKKEQEEKERAYFISEIFK